MAKSAAPQTITLDQASPTGGLGETGYDDGVYSRTHHFPAG